VMQASHGLTSGLVKHVSFLEISVCIQTLYTNHLSRSCAFPHHLASDGGIPFKLINRVGTYGL